MKHNHSNFEDCSESFHTKTNDISIFISKHEQKINMSEAEWVYFLDIISLVHVDVKISDIIKLGRCSDWVVRGGLSYVEANFYEMHMTFSFLLAPSFYLFFGHLIIIFILSVVGLIFSSFPHLFSLFLSESINLVVNLYFFLILFPPLLFFSLRIY